MPSRSRRTNTHPDRSICPAARRCMLTRPAQTHDRSKKRSRSQANTSDDVYASPGSPVESPNPAADRTSASRAKGTGLMASASRAGRARATPSSVHRGVTGHQAQHVVAAAESAEHVLPETVRVFVEHVAGQRWCGDPAFLLEL